MSPIITSAIVLSMDDVQNVRQLMKRINDAWLVGLPDAIPAALEGCFHDAIVFVGPGFRTLGGGKAACIQSYADFMRAAVVGHCNLDEPSIHVAGDTALATYRWTMRWEMNGRESTETGCDIFAFTRCDGRWLACWRAMLPG